MDKKIVTAIIGSGSRANAWASTLKKNKKFELVYSSSESESRGSEFAKKHSCKFFLNPVDIIKKNDVNLFVIANSPSKHILAANIADEKKDIILEKPVSLSFQDLETIYQSCKKNNIICGAGLNRHYDSFLPIVKKLLENQIGKCFHADYTSYFKKNKNDNRFSSRNSKDQENHMFGLVHKFDHANYLFGNPKSVFALNFKTHSTAVVQYENTLFNFSVSNDSNYNYGENINLYCENGFININFNLGKLTASINPLNYKITRSILSKFKQNLLQHRKIFKFEKKKVLESCNFSIGGTQDILDNYCKRLVGEANVDFADIENNYITTKMAFACNDSVQSKKWVEI